MLVPHALPSIFMPLPLLIPITFWEVSTVGPIVPFNRWGNRGSKNLSDLLRVTQLVRSGSEIWFWWIWLGDRKAAWCAHHHSLNIYWVCPLSKVQFWELIDSATEMNKMEVLPSRRRGGESDTRWWFLEDLDKCQVARADRAVRIQMGRKLLPRPCGGRDTWTGLDKEK